MPDTLNLKTEYRGYIIQWEDYSKNWAVYLDTERTKGELPSPDKAQEWIDAQLKRRFSPQKVLILDGWSDSARIVSGIATSLTEDDTEVRVNVKGERSKKAVGAIYLDTPRNQAIMGKIEALRIQLKELGVQIAALTKELAPLTPEMMVKLP